MLYRGRQFPACNAKSSVSERNCRPLYPQALERCYESRSVKVSHFSHRQEVTPAGPSPERPRQLCGIPAFLGSLCVSFSAAAPRGRLSPPRALGHWVPSMFHLGFYADVEKVFFNAKHDRVYRIRVPRYFPPNTSAAIFWLKNRRPAEWRDEPKPDFSELTPSHLRSIFLTKISRRTGKHLRIETDLNPAGPHANLNTELRIVRNEQLWARRPKVLPRCGVPFPST
jgi:hypothetical protein